MCLLGLGDKTPPVEVPMNEDNDSRHIDCDQPFWDCSCVCPSSCAVPAVHKWRYSLETGEYECLKCLEPLQPPLPIKNQQDTIAIQRNRPQFGAVYLITSLMRLKQLLNYPLLVKQNQGFHELNEGIAYQNLGSS